MPAVGLTDHGSLAGAVQLVKETGKVGVKPIIGCEVYVAEDRKAQAKGYAHLTLLAADNAGYSNLIKLSSLGYLEGYYYKPRVDWDLLQTHSNGLIALSGCLSGKVCKALEENRENDAAAELDRLGQIFGKDSVYVEMQNAGLDVQARINPVLARAAETAGLPLVATGDVHYLRHEDARAHEALLCIQSGDSLKNPNHWKFDTDPFFFKSPAEMALDFPGYEHAPGVAHRRARRHRPEGDDLRDAVSSVLLGDVVDDAVASLDSEVDVHVRHRLAAWVQEPLEEQVVADRVDVGDLEAVRGQRTRGAAATRADGDAVLVREADEVPDDQEVVREAHLADRLELELEPLLQLGRDLVVAPLQPVVAKLDQIVERVAAFGRRELGQQDVPELDRDGAALGDLERARQRVLVAGKVERHLGG